jgi:hypothetical protein
VGIRKSGQGADGSFLRRDYGKRARCRDAYEASKFRFGAPMHAVMLHEIMVRARGINWFGVNTSFAQFGRFCLEVCLSQNMKLVMNDGCFFRLIVIL